MLKRQTTQFHSKYRNDLRIFSSRRGQTLVEYALIIAFISIVAIAALIGFGAQTQSLYSRIDKTFGQSVNGVNQ